MEYLPNILKIKSNDEKSSPKKVLIMDSEIATNTHDNSVKSVTHEVGEFVELEVHRDVSESPLYNDDIVPTQINQRTWHKGNVAALWVGMSICVPTYALGVVLPAYFVLSVGVSIIYYFNC